MDLSRRVCFSLLVCRNPKSIGFSASITSFFLKSEAKKAVESYFAKPSS